MTSQHPLWCDTDEIFPPLEQANPDGLLAIGGDLTCERVLRAYRHGCFPWFEDDNSVMWWSPNPRFVLFPDEFHLPKSLKKKGFAWFNPSVKITFDQAFEQVIRACANTRKHQEETWITPKMHDIYCQLHDKKTAHSVEVWNGDQLIGGLYGLTIGRLFCGESMFSILQGASKLALMHLVPQLRDAGYGLIDCQMPSTHLGLFGARNITRDQFKVQIEKWIDHPPLIQWPKYALTTP